jgi:hypothetical protein
MTAHLMNGLLSALRRGWRQGREALHPDPRPALLKALRDTYLATLHTVTQVTQDAERMVYPRFRARLLRMAAEDQGHVTWVRETLLARGGAIPTGACPLTVAPTSGAALRREMAAARRTSEALLGPMHLAEQADPEMAAGFPSPPRGHTAAPGSAPGDARAERSLDPGAGRHGGASRRRVQPADVLVRPALSGRGRRRARHPLTWHAQEAGDQAVRRQPRESS